MTSVPSVMDSERAVVGQGFSAMTSDEFAKVIFAELSRQDPLAPNDTNTLIQQISGIRSIQSNLDLTSRLQALVAQNEFAGAAILLGRHAAGLTDDGRRVSGIVASVSQSREGARVVLRDGTTLRVSAVERVDEEANP
jgi:flagellar basal-body rod modification protein FlgD